MQISSTLLGFGLLAGLSGCATLTESNQQTLLVQAVEDNRELVGVGCILSNQAGKWFVTAPGRVTVQKSVGDLSVDCKKAGGAAGTDQVASRFNNNLWGNLLVSGGLGYIVDRRSGAGFDYPSTLVVIMRARPESEAPAAPGPQPGNVVY